MRKSRSAQCWRVLDNRCLWQALSIHSVAYKQVDLCYIQSLKRTHLLPKMDDTLKTSDRDRNTTPSAGEIVTYNGLYSHTTKKLKLISD
jgi:hypothetical protein